jgi:hypothetical protein
MKSDGPIILAVVLLGAGLTMIFTYGVGTAGLNAAYPISAANLHLSIATSGPAALGGFGLTVLGLLAMIWALLCAIMGMFTNGSGEARLERLERKRIEREEKLVHADAVRLQHEDTVLKHEDRLRASFPKN